MSRKYLLRIACVAILSAVSVNTQAQTGIQRQLNKKFSAMGNFSAPGAYDAQTRGVLSGGQATVKNRIYSENMVSFSPPSWKAGCGGIDLFGGSFSFISGEQLVQLMRSVASNAAGYAFQLALDNVCPDCSKWISEFQNALQQMNEMMSNSCQLAQGIVNDTFKAFSDSAKNDARLSESATGRVKGVFDSFASLKGQDATKKATSEGNEHTPAYKQIVGNIVWKEFKERNVGQWFGYNSDTRLLETMMSITGSLIVHPADKNESEGTNKTTYMSGNKVRLEDLLKGGTFKIYDCAGDDKCLMKNGLKDKNETIDGLRKKIRETLLGGGSSGIGIVTKLGAHKTYTLTDYEKNFVAGLPSSVWTFIRNLAVHEPGIVRMFVEQNINIIAVEMVHAVTNDVMRATRLAVSGSKSLYLKEAYKVLDASETEINREYLQLINEHGSISKITARYNDIVKNLKNARFMISLKNYED